MRSNLSASFEFAILNQYQPLRTRPSHRPSPSKHTYSGLCHVSCVRAAFEQVKAVELRDCEHVSKFFETAVHVSLAAFSSPGAALKTELSQIFFIVFMMHRPISLRFTHRLQRGKENKPHVNSLKWRKTSIYKNTKKVLHCEIAHTLWSGKKSL